MENLVLELEKIAIKLGETLVIDEVSFTLEQGTFLGIIGPNGAGKTTLLRLMGGLLNPEKGVIELSNRPIQKYSRQELACRIGYVPQGVDIEFPFTVYEIVKMGRYARRQGFFSTDEQCSEIIDSALSWMDLNYLKDRPYAQLSGGEKQRTIIASALAQEPYLLLLDEPTSALDLKHQHAIYNRLKELSIQEKKTIVIVTHDINLAAQFCTRLVLVNKGRIIKDGPPDDVLQFQIIQDVYGVKVFIDVNPFTKSIYILPYDTN